MTGLPDRGRSQRDKLPITGDTPNLERMTAESLTAILAERVMGWKVAPDRFIKSGRNWVPRWHFQPLARVENAFQLLGTVASAYTLTKASDGTITAVVSTNDRASSASGRFEATAITLAIAKAIGLDVPEGLVKVCEG